LTALDPAVAGTSAIFDRWQDAIEGKWIPFGGMVLLAGRESIGKTTIAYGIAAKVTRGTLPGGMFGKPRCVIISATADAWTETVVPRLMASGADRDRVFRIDAMTPEGVAEAVKLPDDLAELERIIRAEDVAMLPLDPANGHGLQEARLPQGSRCPDRSGAAGPTGLGVHDLDHRPDPRQQGPGRRPVEPGHGLEGVRRSRPRCAVRRS
jgi:hypothetical protein